MRIKYYTAGLQLNCIESWLYMRPQRAMSYQGSDHLSAVPRDVHILVIYGDSHPADVNSMHVVHPPMKSWYLASPHEVSDSEN